MAGQLFDSYSFFDGLEMEPVTQVNWSNYWRGVIPDGVVAEIEDEMRPYANSTGMYVYVSKGACIVDNHRGVNSALKMMAVNTADATYPRIDLLVARVVYGNENESYMEIDIKTGTPAIDPVAPSLTQSTGDIYEIALAEIYVAAEAVTLAADTVADMRNVFTAASQSISFINDDVVPLEKGMLVILSRNKAGAVKRCGANDQPIGIVRSEYISIGSRGQIATVSGEIAEIACSEAKVQLGDALVPSDTVGIAKAGSGYAGGLALESKESGAVGNVKSLLTIMAKLPYQNAWWIPDGIESDQVIAAYQFVGRPSEADALININDGTVYELTKSGTTVTWNSDTGFYFPAASGAALINTSLKNLYSTYNAAAFGFSGASISTSNQITGGIVPNANKMLMVRGYRSNSTYLNGPAMNNNNTSNVYYSSDRSANGVLGANWITNVLYKNGISLSTTTSSTFATTGSLFGQLAVSDRTFASFYMTAIVIYSTGLTAQQHLELYNSINSLGGIS